MDQLTDEQIAEYREAFSLFDKTGNGRIGLGELGTILRSLGKNPTEAELRKLLDEFKKGKKTEELDFENFLELMAKNMRPTDLQAELLEAFQTFDQDGDGTLDATLLRYILTQVGEKMTEDELDELMAEAMIDDNGKAQFSELKIDKRRLL